MSNLKYLNLNIAKHLISEVEKVAKQRGNPVVIAIVNEWGVPIAIHFMDDSLPASFDIALNKAYTSATVRMSTAELMNLARDNGELFGIINTNSNKIIAFPGGFPLEFNGKVYGGVGVSGGNSKYDNELAFIAKEIYKGVIEWLMIQN